MKKLLIGLFLLFPLLTACTGLPKSQRIPMDKNESYVKPDNKTYDDLEYASYTITTSIEQMVTKINAEDSFVAYFYGEGCHFCAEFKPVFMRYICETRYVFNSVIASANMLEDIYSKLGTIYPDYFSSDTYTGTPYFYFFLKGKLTHSKGLNSTQRSDYNVFKKMMNGYLKSK